MAEMKVPEHALRDLVGVAMAVATVLQCEELSGGEVSEAALAWLSRHLADHAEAAAALAEGRPARWHVLADVRDTLNEMKARGLLPAPPEMREAAE
jgi:hypothetical protein